MEASLEVGFLFTLLCVGSTFNSDKMSLVSVSTELDREADESPGEKSPPC